MQEKNTYVVTVTDTATYVIRADSEEFAKTMAMDYFSERTPTVTSEVDNTLTPEVEF